MPNKSKRFYKHIVGDKIRAHGYSDWGSYWKDVRLWVHVFGFMFSMEWKRNWKQALHLELILGGEEQDVGFYLCFPLIGWFSVHFKFLPYKWNGKLFGYSGHGRHTGISVYDDHINLQFYKEAWAGWTKGKIWNNGLSHSFYYNAIPNFIFGKVRISEKTLLREETVQIALPDGPYILTLKFYEQAKYRTRRPKHITYRNHCEITPSRPAMIPGKGENSWDCGDDAYFSMSCGAKTTAKAVAEFVEHVLARRQKYGGSVNWQPKEVFSHPVAERV